MSKKRGTNVPDQPTVPPMPKRRRYIDESILVEKLHVGEGLQTISRSVLVNCVLPTIPTADVRENVKGRWVEVVDRTEMYDKEGVKTWGMLFQCNQCGFVLNAIEGHTGQYNYCPNCGADMRPISALSENVEIVSNLKRGES